MSAFSRTPSSAVKVSGSKYCGYQEFLGHSIPARQRPRRICTTQICQPLTADTRRPPRQHPTTPLASPHHPSISSQPLYPITPSPLLPHHSFTPSPLLPQPSTITKSIADRPRLTQTSQDTEKHLSSSTPTPSHTHTHSHKDKPSLPRTLNTDTHTSSWTSRPQNCHVRTNYRRSTSTALKYPV
ncbi:hypothetical protein E2C01_055130 [Portunus trituberculatus]|uniref:Uncharacterized protein n=1 Tax=Portunus trituberculatus TaxID=210409 RepID=A0A5B7GV45_PORTR|nr:hypothetical protein [Portunus trituberculatus]